MSADTELVEAAAALFDRLDELPLDDRIDTINSLRLALHEHSPMRNEPVDCVQWIPLDQIQGNEYNPNVVARPEMDLLRRSILDSGYTQPVVAWPVGDDTWEVVDGFHRNVIAREPGPIRDRVHGRLPVTLVRGDRTDEDARVAATIQHNRARGQHLVHLMSALVVDFSRRGKSDEWIGEHLGMDADEVIRLRQVSGLAAQYADEEFSEAWEADPYAEVDRYLAQAAEVDPIDDVVDEIRDAPVARARPTSGVRSTPRRKKPTQGHAGAPAEELPLFGHAASEEAAEAEEVWFIEQAQEFLGHATAQGAQSALRRWGVKPVGHVSHEGRGPARAVYRATEVRDAKARRPGRGNGGGPKKKTGDSERTTKKGEK